MKKVITIGFSIILITVVAIVIAVTLFKHDNGITVITKLSINSDFIGERKITYTVPNNIFKAGSEEETKFNSIITNYCPKDLEYRKTTNENNITYTFIVSFTSKMDYENKVSAILGRETKVTFSNPDTVFMSGWILEEKFESINLLYWINQAVEKEGYSKDLLLKVDSTATFVAFNGNEQETDNIISIKNINGTPIYKIKIDTLNYKDSRYNREITFYIDKNIYNNSQQSINDYFAQRTNSNCTSSWGNDENNHITYTISFKQCDIRQLENYTNNILNSVYSEIEYSKISDSSLFSEEDMFEENLDFSNYVSTNNNPITVEYIYRIQGNTTLSGGSIANADGTWNTDLTYLDENISGKCFAIRNVANTMRVRISDGVQYKLKAINIILDNYKGDNYDKSIEFIYYSDQIDGYNYAVSYFKSKNANVSEITNESNDIICKVSASGSAKEISTMFSLIFENESYMSHSESDKSFDAVINTSLCDYVRLSKILGNENSAIPITYKIYEKSSETTLGIWYYINGNKTDVHLDYTEDGAISFMLPYPDVDIYYNGSYPVIFKIVIMIIIGILVIMFAVFMIIKLRFIPVKEYIMIDVKTDEKEDLDIIIKQENNNKINDDLPWFDQIIDDKDDEK